MSNNICIEICCGSYEDALTAYENGANRIELNSCLALGGLTPSLASLLLSKKHTNIPIICMVRPRGGGFCYSEKEKEEMYIEANILLENEADGIAFGFLNDDYTVDVPATKKMVDLIHSYGKEAVFHRAIDMTNNIQKEVETLISLGVDRILTSGQKESAIEGKDIIKMLQEKYGSFIEILPGSGINETNACSFALDTNVKQIHSSCKSYKIDPTTCTKDISFSCLPKPNEQSYIVVDPFKVKKLVEILK